MLTLAIGDFFVPDRTVCIPQKFTRLLAPSPNTVPTNPKISQVLVTGNITQSVGLLRFLYNLSSSFHITRGEHDDVNILSQELKLLLGKDDEVPLYKVLNIDEFRVGFTNGHQIVPAGDPVLLLAFAREIDVDILVWGGTHKVEAYTLGGKLFINPGSATGAYTFDWPELPDSEEESDDEGEREPKQEQEQEQVSVPVPAQDNEECVPSFCLIETLGPKCTLYSYTCIDEEVKVDKMTFQKPEE